MEKDNKSSKFFCRVILSACFNCRKLWQEKQDEERENNWDATQSPSSGRHSRAAATHNQSERV